MSVQNTLFPFMQPKTTVVDQDYKRVLHIGEIAFSYYQVQRTKPTKQDYDEWLTLLPELLKSRYKEIGFENGSTTIDFRRYFLELVKREMVGYMQKNLSSEDFALWLEKKDLPGTML